MLVALHILIQSAVLLRPHRDPASRIARGARQGRGSGVRVRILIDMHQYCVVKGAEDRLLPFPSRVSS